jgi:hypothetical protein
LKIHITHTYPCDIESFWASWNAQEVTDETNAITKFQQETLRDEVVDSIRILEQRYVSATELPAIARGMMGGQFITYTVVSHIDRSNNTVEWKATPPAMQEQIHASGTMRVLPHEDGCERVVEGQVKVGIPMMGKRVEQQIVDVLGKSYKLIHALQVKWIKAQDDA